jgi:hypothetical protein
MAKDSSPPPESTSADQIAAIVGPFRAAGSLLGFAVGFLATYRSGGAVADSVLHGLLGALLVSPLFWFLGLLLIREAIRVNVEDQKEAYAEQVVEAKRYVAEQMSKQGLQVPQGLRDAVNPRQIGPGS